MPSGAMPHSDDEGEGATRPLLGFFFTACQGGHASCMVKGVEAQNKCRDEFTAGQEARLLLGDGGRSALGGSRAGACGCKGGLALAVVLL